MECICIRTCTTRINDVITYCEEGFIADFDKCPPHFEAVKKRESEHAAAKALTAKEAKAKALKEAKEAEEAQALADKEAAEAAAAAKEAEDAEAAAKAAAGK